MLRWPRNRHRRYLKLMCCIERIREIDRERIIGGHVMARRKL